jgi:hypothetical protein
MEHKRKEERLPVSPTTTFFVFAKNCFSVFSLFSRREGGGGTEGYHVGRCRLHRSYQTSFIVRGVKIKGAKRMDSTDAVKRRSKNGFYTAGLFKQCSQFIAGIQPTISKMGPMIAVGSAKAQGLKEKPISGSEPTRATRARDEATQRVANIWRTRGPIEGTQCPQASYLSLDWKVSFVPLCGLASSYSNFLCGLPGKEA